MQDKADRSQVIVNALKSQFILSLLLGPQIVGLRGVMKMLAVPIEMSVVVDSREFTVILMPDLEGEGYTATCKQIPAAISQGKTIQEAIDNVTDAIELCLEVEVNLKKSRI